VCFSGTKLFLLQAESCLVSHRLIHMNDDQAKAYKAEMGGVYAKNCVGKGAIE
jgi:hypothetical protein